MLMARTFSPVHTLGTSVSVVGSMSTLIRSSSPSSTKNWTPDSKSPSVTIESDVGKGHTEDEVEVAEE